MASLFLAVVLAAAPLTEEEAAKRVYAHLTIRDARSAIIEARRALQSHPQSLLLRQALIRALCEEGEEVEAIEEWQKTIQLFEDQKNSKSLLETLGWGVLSKGEDSQQLNVRLTALMGSAFTRDVKALPLLLRELKSSNAFLRSVAARLSSSFGDAPLKVELLRLLKSEKVWYVRLDVIRAVGHLQMEEAKKVLKEIVADPKTLIEEKAAAIISLISMCSSIDERELDSLIKSNRAGLRLLGCEIITHLALEVFKEKITPLLQDSSPDVRMAALNALGILHGEGSKALELFNDPSPEVAITAAWCAMVKDISSGELALKRWIEGSDPKYRRLASAALAVTGKRGTALSYQLMRSSSDPYVKANLAMALIGQRQHVELACDTLYASFTAESDEKWMWDVEINPLFRSLSPSRIRHIDQIPHYPMVVDQMVRLDVLSILSMMRYPKALTAVKSFLQNQAWGASGSAAATLLEEGDEEALVLVRELLSDPDEKIRVQAALILALVGSDPSAVEVLQEVYPRASRELKMHILEALGHIGDPSSIPFLVEIFKEPFQVLRVIAASALIQCLYH
ncbi:MAG: HEAT repeat domain-containing protein [Chlamydiota bacterium]